MCCAAGQTRPDHVQSPIDTADGVPAQLHDGNRGIAIHQPMNGSFTSNNDEEEAPFTLNDLQSELSDVSAVPLRHHSTASLPDPPLKAGPKTDHESFNHFAQGTAKQTAAKVVATTSTSASDHAPRHEKAANSSDWGTGSVAADAYTAADFQEASSVLMPAEQHSAADTRAESAFASTQAPTASDHEPAHLQEATSASTLNGHKAAVDDWAETAVPAEASPVSAEHTTSHSLNAAEPGLTAGRSLDAAAVAAPDDWATEAFPAQQEGTVSEQARSYGSDPDAVAHAGQGADDGNWAQIALPTQATSTGAAEHKGADTALACNVAENREQDHAAVAPTEQQSAGSHEWADTAFSADAGTAGSEMSVSAGTTCRPAQFQHVSSDKAAGQQANDDWADKAYSEGATTADVRRPATDAESLAQADTATNSDLRSGKAEAATVAPTEQQAADDWADNAFPAEAQQTGSADDMAAEKAHPSISKASVASQQQAADDEWEDDDFGDFNDAADAGDDGDGFGAFNEADAEAAMGGDQREAQPPQNAQQPMPTSPSGTSLTACQLWTS